MSHSDIGGMDRQCVACGTRTYRYVVKILSTVSKLQETMRCVWYPDLPVRCEDTVDSLKTSGDNVLRVVPGLTGTL
jgi:hypothetical protein